MWLSLPESTVWEEAMDTWRVLIQGKQAPKHLLNTLEGPRGLLRCGETTCDPPSCTSKHLPIVIIMYFDHIQVSWCQFGTCSKSNLWVLNQQMRPNCIDIILTVPISKSRNCFQEARRSRVTKNKSVFCFNSWDIHSSSFPFFTTRRMGSYTGYEWAFIADT